jgi:hypothetical protein
VLFYQIQIFMNMRCLKWLLLWVATTSAAPRTRKVHVNYPVDLLGLGSDSYAGNLTLDKLTCFGNRDYGVPTYRETILCMLRVPVMGWVDCHSIWGSRSVVVEVTGSAEFLKLNRLPSGSVFNEHVSLNATRWLELTSASSVAVQRDVKHVPAEPIYLCARSNDWTGAPASFSVTFRPAFLRERDRQLCHSKTLIHLLMVVAMSSAWLLPYLVASVVATLAFAHGIKIMLAILVFSGGVLSLTPLMLTKKNRHLARLYLKYFFTRVQVRLCFYGEFHVNRSPPHPTPFLLLRRRPGGGDAHGSAAASARLPGPLLLLRRRVLGLGDGLHHVHVLRRVP